MLVPLAVQILKLIAFTNLQLQIIKVGELDICGRLLSQIWSHNKNIIIFLP